MSKDHLLNQSIGVLYCNSRGASTEAVAIMALYHIISVFRCMTHSQLAARSLSPTQFNDAHYNLPARSHNPFGHVLGVIGLGDIGFAIAKKVKASFGMQILYNDIVRKEAQEREVSATFYPTLEEMLPKSDCVLIATPFAGKQLITADLLKHFKPGSRLVNIARGSLVDEDALANALEAGRLVAVGMDVHAKEPRVSERLSKNWNATLTSHNGGGDIETIMAFERLSMENVDAVLNGREPLTAVNAHLIQGRNSSAGPRDEVGVHNGHDGTNGHMTNGAHDNDRTETRNIDGQLADGNATSERHGEQTNSTDIGQNVQNVTSRSAHRATYDEGAPRFE